MIEVRIRHCDSANTIRLCDWAADDLDAVLPAIGRWGIYSPEGEYGTKDLTGQIVADSLTGFAYFEIIMNDED